MAGDDSEKTYGIWWFLAAFVALGVIGLAGVLLIGNSNSATVLLPRDSTTSMTTTTVGPEATTAPVTVPGGGPAPEGVREVVSSGGATSYAFTTTAELAQVPIRTVVGRATATPTPEGTALQVTVDCTVGAGEALAQLSITEDAATVTVLPVVLAPADAQPCTAGTVLRQVTVPLSVPIADRQVVLVPAGTEVPTPVAR